MPEPTPAEPELIEHAQAGDLRAFESLYRLHAGRVYGLCLRLTRNEAEAQDCVQDTFISAWRQLSGFRGDSSLATWLHRIAVNRALDRKRRGERERRHLEIVSNECREEAAGADSDAGELEELERAIRKLPARAREVLVLHKIYGYTHEQTAEMLDIAVGTSKAQVHRALKLLADALPGVSLGATGETREVHR
jgi:RNA polymerase sigma-70 factor (ECF subfamily)